MKITYVTTITTNFAHQALALIRSLHANSDDAEVVVYCLDDDTAPILAPVSSGYCNLVSFEDFAPPELQLVRRSMPISAFCWLSKSYVIDHAMKNSSDTTWVCFVDADMMAFADPTKRFVQAGDRSVILNPHAFRYPSFTGTEHIYGHYNAGCIAFRNNDDGQHILDWWQTKCIEHCPATPEPDAFGDQKYLDELAHLFREHVSVGFPLTDWAAWNVGQEKIENSNLGITWKNQPIYIYHFQGLRILQERWVDLYAGSVRLSKNVRQHIYRPYVKELRRAMNDINAAAPSKSGFEIVLSPRELLAHRILSIWGQHNIVRW